MNPSSVNLVAMNAAELRQFFVDCVAAREQAEHIGRLNRLARWQYDCAERLIELGRGSPREVMPLLEHPIASVRLAAGYAVKPLDAELFVATLEALVGVRGKIGHDARSGLDFYKLQQQLTLTEASPPPPDMRRPTSWQHDNPPPAALSRAQLQDRIRARFPGLIADRIVDLMRPAIGLWPQRSAGPLPALTTHLDGQAWAPPNWDWPVYEQEPLYFLGQIYLPDLAGMPGAELLPADGLLAFFGDFDVIAGCIGEYAGEEDRAVHHWPVTDLLPATPPLPLDQYPHETAEKPIAFRAFVDLPHPSSNIIEMLHLSGPEAETYTRLYDELYYHGIPQEERYSCDVDSKLLGWPSLIQNDFSQIPQSGPNAYRLLAQLPARLGPGGSLYFFIREDDLAERRFDRCELTEQNT